MEAKGTLLRTQEGATASCVQQVAYIQFWNSVKKGDVCVFRRESHTSVLFWHHDIRLTTRDLVNCGFI